MNKRQAIPFILLLAAFLVWSYLKPASTVPAQPKHQPRHIGYNISNTHFDKTGMVSYKIFADKTTSFTGDEITVFENPKAIIYIENKDTDRSVWQISSKNGVLFNTNKLLLSNEVLLENLSVDQLVQTMATERLTLLLDQKEISSELLVTWQGPQIEQQGVGMWASLVTEELIVKDNIKAVYLNEKK